MKTMDYLRLTKEKLGIESDYALAARLGVTRGTMSNFKRGRNFLGDDIAMQIAEILNKP
ncbi:MAG: helix-turn-helix domain-containing protein, partial [Burkholderiaceae bacterium]